MPERFIPLTEAMRRVRDMARDDEEILRNRALRIEEELEERGVPLVINDGGRAYCPCCRIRIWHYTRYCPNCVTMIRW